MRFSSAKKVAIGGLLAALATVIVTLGSMIPLSTYVCPVICMILCYVVMRLCGIKLAWAWYVVAAVLSLLFAPDIEAAGVFLIFGYYPVLKTVFDKISFGILLKFAYFNTSAVLLYLGLIYLLGLTELLTEFGSMGAVGFAVLILLGNVTFLLVDRLLRLLDKRF